MVFPLYSADPSKLLAELRLYNRRRGGDVISSEDKNEAERRRLAMMENAALSEADAAAEARRRELLDKGNYVAGRSPYASADFNRMWGVGSMSGQGTDPTTAFRAWSSATGVSPDVMAQNMPKGYQTLASMAGAIRPYQAGTPEEMQQALLNKMEEESRLSQMQRQQALTPSMQAERDENVRQKEFERAMELQQLKNMGFLQSAIAKQKPQKKKLSDEEKLDVQIEALKKEMRAKETGEPFSRKLFETEETRRRLFPEKYLSSTEQSLAGLPPGLREGMGAGLGIGPESNIMDQTGYMQQQIARQFPNMTEELFNMDPSEIRKLYLQLVR